ncbi:MAG: hypothetical protein FD146_2322 [Anaerolineaceae bacterium]|nr:MAG: hypothetical protein FD146_2322 [Anaerolineaceae bacterium]
MKRAWTLALLFLLAGCGSGFAAELDAQPGDALYQDDFSDPSSGWPRISAEVGAMDYYNGVYRILVNAADYDLWSAPGKNYTDVRLEVDAARLAGPAENRFGLVCRYRSAQDFYFFVISSDGYYTIGKFGGGVVSLLGQPTMAYNAAIVTGVAPNHLRFDCVGASLTGYVNGQMVAITQDAAFPDGDVGLIAGAFDVPGVDVVFDNFVVMKP